MTDALYMYLAQLIGLAIFALTIPLWCNKPRGKYKNRPPRHTHKRIARKNEHAA
jgi:hypothetical protein